MRFGRLCSIGVGLLIASVVGGGLGLLFLPILVPIAVIVILLVRLLRRSVALTTLAVLLLMFTGCYDRNAQNSPIVRFVEANGSGDISTYSEPGLMQWFGERPTLGAQVYGLCAPKYSTSGANWATSAEGTVCMTVRQYAPRTPLAVVTDQRTW